MRFPPVMSRGQLERSGYLKSFPNLLGCVCGLHGTEREIDVAVSRFDAGGDWTAALSPADLVLSPAACYPVYPIAASRGPVPEGGLLFDVAADCFRREPSQPSRPAAVVPDARICLHRQPRRRLAISASAGWCARRRSPAISALTFRVDYASDPFFGRVGQMKAVSQKQQALKFELLIPLRSEEQPTACMSFNYHREHFGITWDIADANGEPAHTGCVAFGMDRLAVAMFHTHGSNVARWPDRGAGPARLPAERSLDDFGIRGNAMLQRNPEVARARQSRRVNLHEKRDDRHPRRLRQRSGHQGRRRADLPDGRLRLRQRRSRRGALQSRSRRLSATAASAIRPTRCWRSASPRSKAASSALARRVRAGRAALSRCRQRRRASAATSSPCRSSTAPRIRCSRTSCRGRASPVRFAESDKPAAIEKLIDDEHPGRVLRERRQSGRQRLRHRSDWRRSRTGTACR